MKKKYIDLCKQEDSIPIFSQYWWLDAVAGRNNWNVVMVKNKNEILATMPYLIKKKYGMSISIMPQLTQTLGPWIKPDTPRNHSKDLSNQKMLMNGLITQLPRFDYFSQNWNHKYTNWLPFYWSGYNQTTRYTYIIDCLDDHNQVISNFSRSKRKNIRKSEKDLNIVFDISFSDFYENHKLTLSKQGRKISYSKEIFEKIYKAGYKHKSAKTIAAYDNKGNLHGALFIIWDKMSAYDLISTIDPDFRNSGAASVLVKEAIKFSSVVSSSFDFEGSMIEGVEHSFRQFGAKQTPYFKVYKSNSKLFSLANCFRSLIKSY